MIDNAAKNRSMMLLSCLTIFFNQLLTVVSQEAQGALTHINFVTASNNPVNALGLCEGDCDNDRHCQEGLFCYQRQNFEAVPGCAGGEYDASRTDYCAPKTILFDTPSGSPSGTPTVSQEPSQNPTTSTAPSEVPTTSTAPSKVPTEVPSSSPTSPFPTGSPSTAPSEVPTTTTAPSKVPTEVPSSSPTSPFPTGRPTTKLPTQNTPAGEGDNGSREYSDGVSLVEYGADPPASRMPLGLCEGDCDNDSQCRGQLVCFQRGPHDPVPGCIGVDASKTDYCIDPNAREMDPNEQDEERDADAEEGYIPGLLTTHKLGLLLSQGLDARLVAISGDYVDYSDGRISTVPFHGRPDAGACFADTRGNNPGGWIYVSNSEMHEIGAGGVGAITFDAQGNTIEYKRVLDHTTSNCGGGRTPWGTWISCEERAGRQGNAYQVDPTGLVPSQKIVLGDEGGQWESFAYDNRDPTTPHFYITEDHPWGALARYTPNNPDWSNPWDILHDPDGTKDYLVLRFEGADSGTFFWSTSREDGMVSAELHYPLTEGIDRRGSELFFVCKAIRMIYTLQLDQGTWHRSSTVSGLFDGHPDQLQRILQFPKDLLYFTEEGIQNAGIHARDETARFYTIMESPDYPGETTGLSFSPDGRFMYVAYQDIGRLFCIWRIDGKPFGAEQLDIKYHNTPPAS